ncbi:MAG TPA: hypothetical protein VMG36_05680 [Thermoplasmata archaeon]|nr:hypothetical protein [Thermoplasmata archaeon]
MFLGLLGRFLQAVARFRPGEEGRDLAHFGEELVRLDRRPRQPRSSSR